MSGKNIVLAPVGKRVLAFILDSLFSVFPVLVTFILWAVYTLSQSFFGFGSIVLISLLLVIAGIVSFGWLLYSLVMQYRYIAKSFQSFGMKRVGIKYYSGSVTKPWKFYLYFVLIHLIVSINGSGVLFFIVIINFLWIFFDKQRRTFLGLLLGVRVVNN